jgi:hypothetical protein
MFSILDIKDSCFFAGHEAGIHKGLVPVQFGLGIQSAEEY